MVFVLLFLSLLFSVCSCDSVVANVDPPPTTEPVPEPTPEATPEQHPEPTPAPPPEPTPESTPVPETQLIRGFEDEESLVLLLPDGYFMAALFHGIAIMGTYDELTQGDETAVLFTYEEDGRQITVVGGIVDANMSLPEDWDDGHGHGAELEIRVYPFVFAADDDNYVALYDDNSFVANLGQLVITGEYDTAGFFIVFITDDGQKLYANLEIEVVGDDDHNHHHGHGHSHDDEECVHIVVVLPTEWPIIYGAEYVLQ